MNHGYSRSYTPVLRNPNLFHQNTIRPSPGNNPIQTVPIPVPSRNFYYQYPSPYAPQLQKVIPPSTPYMPLAYSYPHQFTGSPSLSHSPYLFNSMPTYSYAPTVSSKGLSLILISTLILVALDLVLVRPQRSKSEVRCLKFDAY